MIRHLLFVVAAVTVLYLWFGGTQEDRETSKAARGHAFTVSRSIEAQWKSVIHRTYPVSLLNRIHTLYIGGIDTVTGLTVDDKQITHVYARDWVLDLYQDMFSLAGEVNQDMPTAERLERHLDRDSIPVLHTHLTSMLEHADEELMPDQRRHLYRLLGSLVTLEENPRTMELLLQRASEPERLVEERQMIIDAIASIRRLNLPKKDQ